MAAEDKAQLGPVAGGGSAAVDVAAKSSEDLSMIAWQKAFDAFAADLKPNELDHWVARLIGDDSNKLMLPPDASAKDRLTKWVQVAEVDDRIAACRSQMVAFSGKYLERKEDEHRLILLLAIHAVMQVSHALDTCQQLRCPESHAYNQQYEIAIGVVAHLFYGQGCVLEMRAGQWRVTNMIRTDALEPLEANPTRNGNIRRIEREVLSYINRTERGWTSPTSDIKRFKSEQGGMPFILDVKNVLDAQVCAALSQQLNLKVVPVGNNDTQQIQPVLERVNYELVEFFSAAHHSHQTKKEDTMTDQPVGKTIYNTWNVTGNVGAVAQGDGAQQTVVQNNNSGNDEKLDEFEKAMQAIQGMLKDESKKQELQEVIEIARKKSEDPKDVSRLSQMMASLKQGAEKMVFVTDTIDAADKVKTQATVAAAALVQYWPMVQSWLA